MLAVFDFLRLSELFFVFLATGARLALSGFSFASLGGDVEADKGLLLDRSNEEPRWLESSLADLRGEV